MGDAMSLVSEDPDLTGFVPLEQAPLGFVDGVSAAFEADRSIANTNARVVSIDRMWRQRLEEVERTTGVRLPHPRNSLAPMFLADNATAFNLFGSVDGEGESGFENRTARLEREIDSLRQSRPEYESLGSAEDWRAQLAEELRELDERAEGAGALAGFTGGLGAALTDPFNLITMGFGGSSKTVLAAAVKEAGIGALSELAVTPIEARWRREMGLDELTAGDVARRVAAGAALGGALGGGGRALELSAPRVRALAEQAFGRLPAERQAAALRELAPDDDEALALARDIERAAEIDAANPFEPGVEADAIHADMLERATLHAQRDIASDLFEHADRLDADAAGAPAPIREFNEPSEDAVARAAEMEALRADQLSLRQSQPDDEFPTGLIDNETGQPQMMRRADIENGLDAEARMIEVLQACPALGGAQ